MDSSGIRSPQVLPLEVEEELEESQKRTALTPQMKLNCAQTGFLTPDLYHSSGQASQDLQSLCGALWGRGWEAVSVAIELSYVVLDGMPTQGQKDRHTVQDFSSYFPALR